MSIADEIVEILTKYNRYIDEHNRMVFTMDDAAEAKHVKELLNKWYWSRMGYGPWKKDGDHWDHKHPSGLVFHHPDRGCPEQI